MDIGALIKNKSIKPKEKTVQISGLLLRGDLGVHELIAFADKAKDAEKATCIESLEFTSKINASLVSVKAFTFVCEQLASKAPRVKWESAKVIANSAHLFPEQLNTAIGALLPNTEDKGTVVRWSAAYALGEVMKINGKHQANLLKAIESIVLREEKNSIKKIYLSAIKKAFEA